MSCIVQYIHDKRCRSGDCKPSGRRHWDMYKYQYYANCPCRNSPQAGFGYPVFFIKEAGYELCDKAKGEYSRDRLRYLADEWHADYPNLINFAMILKKKRAHFRIGDLSDKDCEEFCLNFCVSDQIQSDYLSNLASHVVDMHLFAADFRKNIFLIFYQVGIVGLKIESYEKFAWTTSDRRNISSAEISDGTRVAVHPAFWRVLGIGKA